MRPSRRQAEPFIRRWSGGRPSATVLLVAIFTGAFVSQWIIEAFEPEHMVDPDWLRDWLALNADAWSSGHWWQFLTFGFLHANILQLIGNVLLIYFAGREVEPILGSRQTVGIFLTGHLLGGLVHWVAMPEFTLMGVSGGAAALVAAYATTLPGLEVVGHLFFVLPLKLPVKYFGLGLATFGAVCWLTQSIPELAPAAIFTGCLAGWIYARQLGFGNPFWFQRMIFDQRQREARIARMPTEQFMAEEVDPILEKIAEKGVASLTRSERQILQRGSEKIAEKSSH